jgi:hypothetical protein
MKSTYRILIVIVALMPWLAFARLGDTPESLAQRMGVAGSETTAGVKPALANSRTFVFQKDGINLVVTFWNGKSCEEIYKKSDGGEFSDAEIQTMLKNNNFGVDDWVSDYTKGVQVSGIKHWAWGEKSDGTASGLTPPILQAYYARGQFSVFTTKYRQASDAADKGAAQKKIQRF